MKRFSIRRSHRAEEASEAKHNLQTDGQASRPPVRESADQAEDLSPLGEVKREAKRSGSD